MRFSRLKCLKSRDDCMQAVLAEAASKLPSLISGPGYASLLESLILEALTRVNLNLKTKLRKSSTILHQSRAGWLSRSARKNHRLSRLRKRLKMKRRHYGKARLPR